MKNFFNKVLGTLKAVVNFFLSDTKRLVILIAIVVIVGIISLASASAKKEAQLRQEAIDKANQEALEKQQQTQITESQEGVQHGGSDQYLLASQDELKVSYGSVPDGYIWDYDGTLLSLGDKNMTAEEVVYAYLNGLRTLDISMAQKYSRYSRVVGNYSDYFSTNYGMSDYYDSFIRNMYKEVLLSMQVKGITDVSVFAENKQVFTVKINLLDLTDKDFWLEDKYDIYNTLYIYSADEDDSAKSEMYLYDYVLDYYRSDQAKSRDLLINLTVERYPDLDTGWLVSIDSDLNDACIYSDGNLMVSYINSMYFDEGADYVRELREQEKQEHLKEQEALEEQQALEEDALGEGVVVQDVNVTPNPTPQGTTVSLETTEAGE